MVGGSEAIFLIEHLGFDMESYACTDDFDKKIGRYVVYNFLAFWQSS